ncbi:unnamed protein product [Pleuronectes platessa]|uniref:Serine/threonine-protein kinase D1-3-like ubiquitin-like domain-containing protein n=1 Tax=Pleuronectes platessa TaxID=8262 RepID=A0A9N7UIZ6_PLEPL|nr:unnamed protein product [Pleuronectes platessa]
MERNAPFAHCEGFLWSEWITDFSKEREHHCRPHHPPSSPGPLYTRLSNGSHSAPSPTNSRSSFHGVSFLLQIGLTRETVNLEASDLSLSAVRDLVCSIVDQKWQSKFFFLLMIRVWVTVPAEQEQ